MNKYVEILIQQNPKYEIECENCNYKFFVKTKDIFDSGDTYTTNCPKCCKQISYTNINKWVRQAEKEMKDAGIEIF